MDMRLDTALNKEIFCLDLCKVSMLNLMFHCISDNQSDIQMCQHNNRDSLSQRGLKKCLFMDF